MIQVWYTNGIVQEYPSVEDAETEIAEIMQYDSFPFALVKNIDGTVYKHHVTIKLEPIAMLSDGDKEKEPEFLG